MILPPGSGTSTFDEFVASAVGANRGANPQARRPCMREERAIDRGDEQSRSQAAANSDSW